MGKTNMIAAWQALCHELGDALLGWVLLLQRDIAVLFIGAVIGLALLLIRRLTVDKEAMVRVRRDQRRLRILLAEARAAKDQERLGRLRRVRTRVAGRRARLESFALFVSLILSAVIATWGSARLEYLPVGLSMPVRLVARFPASYDGELAHVVPMDGVSVEPGWIQRIRGAFVEQVPGGVAGWTLHFAQERPFFLVIRCGRQSVAHSVRVGSPYYDPPVRAHRGGLTTEVELTPYRPFGWFPAWMWPGVPGWVIVLTLSAAACYWVGANRSKVREDLVRVLRAQSGEQTQPDRG